MRVQRTRHGQTFALFFGYDSTQPTQRTMQRDNGNDEQRTEPTEVRGKGEGGGKRRGIALLRRTVLPPMATRSCFACDSPPLRPIRPPARHRPCFRHSLGSKKGIALTNAPKR